MSHESWRENCPLWLVLSRWTKSRSRHCSIPNFNFSVSKLGDKNVTGPQLFCVQDYSWERGFKSIGGFLAVEWRLESSQILNTKYRLLNMLFCSSEACRKQDSEKSLWLAWYYRSGWSHSSYTFLKLLSIADSWKKRKQLRSTSVRKSLSWSSIPLLSWDSH